MSKDSQILKLNAISDSLSSGAMLKAKLILNGLKSFDDRVRRRNILFSLC